MKNVLVVEDHLYVAEATARLISAAAPEYNATLCLCAGDARRLLTACEIRWDRILLDLDVPGARGLSLAMEICALDLQAKTCVVSATARDDFSARLKSMGFLGYILKASSSMVSDFQAIFRGERLFPGPPRNSPDSLFSLTTRQLEVLGLVALGLSTKQAAAQLGLAIGTVENHMKAIRISLDVHSRSHAVAKAIEMGMLQ